MKAKKKRRENYVLIILFRISHLAESVYVNALGAVFVTYDSLRLVALFCYMVRLVVGFKIRFFFFPSHPFILPQRGIN